MNAVLSKHQLFSHYSYLQSVKYDLKYQHFKKLSSLLCTCMCIKSLWFPFVLFYKFDIRVIKLHIEINNEVCVMQICSFHSTHGWCGCSRQTCIQKIIKHWLMILVSKNIWLFLTYPIICFWYGISQLLWVNFSAILTNWSLYWDIELPYCSYKAITITFCKWMNEIFDSILYS